MHQGFSRLGNEFVFVRGFREYYCSYYVSSEFCLLILFKLRLIGSESSGLLTAVHKDYFRVVNYRELLFHDCGDRVAQLLHVELAVPFSQCRNNDIRQEILIVNTHLLFPHDSSLCLVRLNQVGALLFAFVQLFTASNSNSNS